MKKRNHTLRRKVVIGAVALCLVSSGYACMRMYTDASFAFRTELRERLMHVASVSASQIDGALLRGIHTPADQSKPEYRALREKLHRMKQANDSVRYIYIMRRTSKPGTLEFVVDESTGSDASKPGDSYDVGDAPEMAEGFDRPNADREITRDKWGESISGYAPIRDSQGVVQGMLGLDMTAARLRREEAVLHRSAAVSVFVTVLLAVLFSLIGARMVLRRVQVFMDGAARVEEGDLDCRIDVQWKDETGNLASLFNRMVAGLKESRDRLIEGTSKDFLTGLYNHMYFHTRLDEELSRAKRHDRFLSVLMIDLDRFKSINDTLGHLVGDSALAQLAAVIKAILRDTDIAVRYGGDELAVILPETNSEQAMQTAERIRAGVEAHHFKAIPLTDNSILAGADEGKFLQLTVTIGVATFPEDHDSKDGLAMAADIALCRAKHVRRNSVMVYERSDSDDSLDPQELYKVLHDPNRAAVDTKDRYTSGHSERVSHYAETIASAMFSDQTLVDELRIAGLLHDLGKIGVSDSVLNKRGTLSQDERAEINKHPVLGGNILKRAPQLDQIVPAILFHHERWDGKGYPDGLKGEEIPLIARIMAVADAFDAMTSDRPYRKAMAIEAALTELRAGAGQQFDPKVVEAFLSSYMGDDKKAA